MDVEGYNVTFATERGLKAQPDEQKVKPSDIASNILAAEYEIRELYKGNGRDSHYSLKRRGTIFKFCESYYMGHDHSK